MIEELTPQLIARSLFLIVVAAPTLTLLLSALLLRSYRRAVTRAMTTVGEFDTAATATTPRPTASSQPGADAVGDRDGRDLYQMARRGPGQCAIRYAIAGLAFALVFALAARFAIPIRVDLPGVLIGVWIYAWPIVLALPLIVPGSRWRWLGVIVYVVAFLPLGLWAAWVTDLPDLQHGGINLPARSSMTPPGMTALWLVVNGAPTLLMLVCFNRRVRAVAPLVLALVTTIISGTWIAVIAILSRAGADAAVAMSVSLDVHVYWLVAATVVLSLAGFGALGWGVARWIAAAYRRRKLSDQSLLLDALWLLFASSYVMWLVLGGLVWAATAPVALLVFKLVLAAVRRIQAHAAGLARGLTFLRVFALGRRSDALLDSVARYWRHVGSVQMITGPDVALSTVQPHQFLDFLSGKLARHFVRDQASLERSLADRDLTRDPDGRFRINNFFCHADTWQPVLPRLVEDGGTVMMDLRSFSARDAGCIHELRHLMQRVPLDRFLLIVDRTTDEAFLDRMLHEASAQLSPASPNHGRSLREATVHRFESGTADLQALLRRLCGAGMS